MIAVLTGGGHAGRNSRRSAKNTRGHARIAVAKIDSGFARTVYSIADNAANTGKYWRLLVSNMDPLVRLSEHGCGAAGE